MNAWRARQFDYQWLRTLAGQYANFLQATEESLVFASKQPKVTLSADQRRHAFESVVSTDQIRSYKPDPRAYQLAIDTLQLQREEILFVAFAGWDVAGAKWFGYPTFWANRLGSPMEELGVEADASGTGLNALVRFVLENRGH